MTTAVKKVSLRELALSLVFKEADQNDPIYQEGWLIMSSVGQELGRLDPIKKPPKHRINPTEKGLRALKK